MSLKQPIFAVSDLHIGDGGTRDNFAVGNCEKSFYSFLEYVHNINGKLIIVGDFFELWQSNISKVLTKRMRLLYRLAEMDAVYVLGNHDADLRYFINEEGWLSHSFFNRMCNSYHAYVGSKLFRFVHGHHVDPYCNDDKPGVGRISAIYTGMKEDRNGGPAADKYRTIEQKTLGRLEKISRLKNWVAGKPSLAIQMNRGLRNRPQAIDVVVCGHTHAPGRIGSWLYNCGTWAEDRCSFVKISDDGMADVFDWVNSKAILNTIQLPI